MDPLASLHEGNSVIHYVDSFWQSNVFVCVLQCLCSWALTTKRFAYRWMTYIWKIEELLFLYLLCITSEKR